jgi:hypothetical protein
MWKYCRSWQSFGEKWIKAMLANLKLVIYSKQTFLESLSGNCFSDVLCPFLNIYSREGLRSQHTSPNSSLVPIYKVTKRVYASPSRANFQVDFRSKVCLYASNILPSSAVVCVQKFENVIDMSWLQGPLRNVKEVWGDTHTLQSMW